MLITIVPLNKRSWSVNILLPVWQDAAPSAAFLPDLGLLWFVSSLQRAPGVFFAWMILGTVNLLCSLFIWENLKELISLFVKLFLAAWKESQGTEEFY